MNDDLKALIIRAQEGDKKALEVIIKNNEGLIWSTVKRFACKGYDKDDLYQLAAIGFIKSIKRFDFNFNVRLSTYAVEYMIGEIKKFIRDDGIIKISRSIRELSHKVNELEKDILNRTGSNVKLNKLAKILDVSEEEIVEAKKIINNVKSLNDEIQNDDGSKYSFIDKNLLEDTEEEKIVDKIMLLDSVNALNVRDKNIIDLRYFKEKTQSQVAKMLGISQVQVSRIERKILSKLKESMA